MSGKGRIHLNAVNLKGFKSIDADGQEIHFGDITILLGANGAGKSNLVSFFSMLNYMMTGSLQTFIGENGFAESFLHYGPKTTSRMQAMIHFSNQEEADAYEFYLSHAAGDTLIFTNETVTYHDKGQATPLTYSLPPGGKESGLLEERQKKRSQNESGDLPVIA